jgi:DNA-binding NarL/FixJ family response regulator
MRATRRGPGTSPRFAARVCTQHADVDELVDALRQVVAGRSVVDPHIVEVLLAGRHGQHDQAGQRLALLTSREAEVLRIMAEGKTNRAPGG